MHEPSSQIVSNNDAIALRVKATVAPVANIQVLRALPSNRLQAIGPFIFLDHIGPIPTLPKGISAHPHAGIEVITCMLEGANEHRDSYGHIGRVTSGGAQWITAGKGILHAEQPLAESPIMHAIQLWTRLPQALQDCEPRYQAISAESVPEIHIDRNTLRLLAGDLSTLSDASGPVRLAQKSLLVHIKLAPKERLVVPIDVNLELGLYGIEGETYIGTNSEPLARGTIAALNSSNTIELANHSSDKYSELLLLGGEPAERPLVFYGPFVFNSLEKAKQAEHDYFAGRMGYLDGVPAR